MFVCVCMCVRVCAYVRVCIHVCMCVCIHVCAYSLYSGFQSYGSLHPFRVGAIFFIIMNQVFGNLSATELFIKQRALFM